MPLGRVLAEDKDISGMFLIMDTVSNAHFDAIAAGYIPIPGEYIVYSDGPVALITNKGTIPSKLNRAVGSSADGSLSNCVRNATDTITGHNVRGGYITSALETTAAYSSDVEVTMTALNQGFISVDAAGSIHNYTPSYKALIGNRIELNDYPAGYSASIELDWKRTGLSSYAADELSKVKEIVDTTKAGIVEACARVGGTVAELGYGPTTGLTRSAVNSITLSGNIGYAASVLNIVGLDGYVSAVAAQTYMSFEELSSVPKVSSLEDIQKVEMVLVEGDVIDPAGLGSYFCENQSCFGGIFMNTPPTIQIFGRTYGVASIYVTSRTGVKINYDATLASLTGISNRAAKYDFNWSNKRYDYADLHNLHSQLRQEAISATEIGGALAGCGVEQPSEDEDYGPFDPRNPDSPFYKKLTDPNRASTTIGDTVNAMFVNYGAERESGCRIINGDYCLVSTGKVLMTGSDIILDGSGTRFTIDATGVKQS